MAVIAYQNGLVFSFLFFGPITTNVIGKEKNSKAYDFGPTTKNLMLSACEVWTTSPNNLLRGPKFRE